MEAVISDLCAHNIQNRIVAIIENGSWAATSGNLIRSALEKCKNINFIEDMLSIKSGLKKEQLSKIDAMAEALIATFTPPQEISKNTQSNLPPSTNIDQGAMFKLSYGLFVLSAKEGDKDNGCIVNTVTQITASPLRISVAVNKANFTREMILNTGEFNVSILTESAPFRIFENFGFHSGRDTDKFASFANKTRAANGILYLNDHANAIISAKVTESIDYETHTLFIADVTQAFVITSEPSVTYQYYFDHIKPKPQAPKEGKKGFVCKICGYVFEGENLPADFICPLCKHGAEDFEKA
jgi:flavin reductase (DIM6/NTAB) family NADH-FMN oxidoreductase RutF